MRITIFGAGALGSLLGGFLSGKHDVTLIGRSGHVEAIRRDGLRVEGLRSAVARPAAAKSGPDGSEDPELLLLTVKAYDTRAALDDVRRATRAQTTILSAQNGLGNFEALREAFPTHTVLAATVTYGASVPGPGRVHYAGQGEILVGGTVKEFEAGARVARVLRDAGLQALGVPDVRGPVWQKAIVNAAINPLSALRGVSNGELLEDPETVERMKAVCREAAQVARALKVQLPERDPYLVAVRVAHATAPNRSSMLQDIERGRRTEIEQITGVIVAEGRRLGIATPQNQSLLEAVLERQRGA